MPPTTSPAVEAKPATVKTLAENVKDTLESIVVAFILAFVFRAFIVEAFVIPTGSMAVTLYGNQRTMTCSTCGYEYALGITERMVGAITLRCPNCDTFFDRLTAGEVAQPDSGDRILVHKWPLCTGIESLGPRRWDVTVFKDPRDGGTNFIKRLVGLPGEVLEIIDGDVYAVPLKGLKPELIDKMNQLRLDVYARRAALERQTDLQDVRHQTDVRQQFLKRFAEINEQILPLLKIQRKLPALTIAQKSLWFNVFDNDFLPTYRTGGAAGGGAIVGCGAVDDAAAQAWKTSEREFSFHSESPQPLEIQFVGKEIDDFYAYNGDSLSDHSHRQAVGDVRVRFVWIPESGTGGLRLTMNRDNDDFVASIGVDGSVKLEGEQPELDLPGHHQVIGEKKLPAFTPGQWVSIEFINLDYRVAVLIDGQEVIATKDEQYGPQLAKLKRIIAEAVRQSDGYIFMKPTNVRIAASQSTCRLRHLALERDVYYRSQQQQELEGRDEKGNVTGYNPYYLWAGWATAGMPMMLRPKHQVDGKEFGAEYLMLGDNSPASKDSRLWWEIGPHLKRLESDYQAGSVPEDQLIGKAFFVYWPAGYRPSWSPGVGLIPNFGRMRWIR